MEAANGGYPAALPGHSALRTIPSSDRSFAAHVLSIVGRSGVETPEALEARLRRIYPHVVVRARDLAGESRPIWYVYREGRWVGPAEAAWWTDEELARFVIDREGFITWVNQGAVDFVGGGTEALVGRHFTDFVVPGTLEDVAPLHQILLEVGEVTSTVQFSDAGGQLRRCQQHSEVRLDGVHTVLRPLEAETILESLPAPRSIELSCVPAQDRLFERLAQQLLARMPEPTAGGLQLRLRRIYPEAMVFTETAVRWTVRRDERPVPTPGWWDDPSSARVVWDGQALILDANEAADALLATELVGRHWHEFAPAGVLAEADRLAPLFAELGTVDTVWSLVDAQGQERPTEHHTTFESDHFVTVLRPLTGDDPA